MMVKDVPPGQIFKLWQVGAAGSLTRICLKLQTGESVDVTTGELVHIHKTKNVETALSLPGGRIGSLKGRPCFVSAYQPGRVFVEYFIVVASEIAPEILVVWPNNQAKYGIMSKEVDIILKGVIYLLRKAVKLLRGQADTLESLVDVDITPVAANIIPPTTKTLDSG